MRRLSRLATLALPLLGPACSASEASERPPSAERIVLVTCDTLRADRLGVYGNERALTPELDLFARECVLFEEAYSSAPMTQPAVSSLLSGQLPTEIGTAPGNVRLMAAEVETLAERLRTRGYATAAVVSNWVLRKAAADEGDVGVQQGFEHFDDRLGSNERIRQSVKERLAADTTDDAIAWLAARPTDAFFLWVHYQDPHGPYTPPKEYGRRFHSPDRGRDEVPLGTSLSGAGHIPTYQALGGETDPEVYRDLYDAEVHYFDHEFGRLLRWLREADLLDGALVVFTADHGESLGEHDFWFSHGEHVHREVVRIPLLVRWPDGAPPADFGPPDADGVRRCARLVSHLDFVPTVLAALDLGAPALRGTSLYARRPPAGRAFAQDLWPAGSRRSRWWSLSVDHLRLVWSEDFEAPRLFDIASDPTESRDLAGERSEKVLELSRLHAQVAAADEPRAGREMNLEQGERETLGALGYTAAGEDE